MKFTLDKLTLAVELRDLTIDSNETKIDGIIGEITRVLSQVIYNRFGRASEIEVVSTNTLEVAKEELNRIVHITNLTYDLEDEEIEERQLPISVNVSLKDLDINYCCIIEDEKNLKDVIKIALDYYLVDKGFALQGEHIVENFNYKIEK